jgi:hypothetical protein
VPSLAAGANDHLCPTSDRARDRVASDQAASPLTNRSNRRVAIVTGASCGIGDALAVAMAAQRTHAVLVARSVDLLTTLAARIEGAGGKATVLPMRDLLWR